MHKKKGQITIFIILGIIILLIVGLAIYVTLIQKKLPEQVQIVERVSLTIERATLNQYVSRCLSLVVERGTRLAALQGGYINPVGSLKYDDFGDGYEVHYYYGGLPVSYNLIGTEITLPSKEDLAETIEKFTLVELDDCLNLSVFEQQGLVVQKPIVEQYTAGQEVDYASGELKVSLVIRENDIIAKAHYPILLERAEQKVLIENFTANVRLRLGRVYDIVEQILTEAATSTSANKFYRITDRCSALAAPDNMINIYFVPNVFRQDYLLKVIDAAPVETARPPLKFHTGIRNVKIGGECIG